MKTILATTDFSPVANNAVYYAADMARAIHANLLLLNTCQMPVSYNEMGVMMNVEDVLEIAEKDMEQFVTQLTRENWGDLKIETEVRLGVFFHELKEVCEKVEPYAVVMGSQGTTEAERFFFGSHTVHAAKNLMWPLITVPAGVKFGQVKKIGLACDFKNVLGTIPVEEIKTLVKDFNAELHVLNTGTEKAFDPDLVFQSGLLQEMMEGLDPAYHFITNADTGLGILEFTEQNHIDLLIVFPKRHDLLDKLVHKSHSRQLVLHSHVPVMALHH